MLDSIVENIKILCDNKVDNLAALNCLQANLAYIFSIKDIKFKSIQNVVTAKPLAYYCLNFVPSGGVKNKLEDEIKNNIVLPVAGQFIKQYNDKRLEELKCKQIMDLQGISDKVEMRRKKQEQESEYKKVKDNPLKITFANATQASIYNTLKIIKDMGYGSSMIYNPEFALFYEDAIVNRDKTKKEFLDMLYNLYDGEYQSTNTVSTAREDIDNIPAIVIFLSDYRLYSENEKLAQTFKGYMARGMARRSFVYFRNDINYYSDDFEYPTFEQKQKASDILKGQSRKIKDIFDRLEVHTTYNFSPDANKRINQYKKEVNKRIREFYKYTNKLSIENEILKLNLEHSTWKIIKLAVLYHILDTEGYSDIIEVGSFNKAIQFFNKTHNCLDLLLKDRSITDYDKLYNHLISNINHWVSKMELRGQNIVPARDFKMWFDDAMLNISEQAESKGFAVVSRSTGLRNQGMEVALFDPSVYRFDSKIVDNVEKGQLVKIDNSDIEVSVI